MGFFKVEGKEVTAVVRIGQDKNVYSLEVLEGSKSLARKDITYY